MGRDPGRPKIIIFPGQFQSTRPHGARPFDYSKIRKSNKVSIHAPAWGATYFPEQIFKRFAVSIHAPAWGATFDFLNIGN